PAACGRSIRAATSATADGILPTPAGKRFPHRGRGSDGAVRPNGPASRPAVPPAAAKHRLVTVPLQGERQSATPRFLGGSAPKRPFDDGGAPARSAPRRSFTSSE